MPITAGLLKSLLDEGGLGYKQNSKSFILDCPRCRKHEKLYIRKNDGRFVCWYCKETDGFQGAPEYAFRELLNRPVAEFKQLFYGDAATAAHLILDLELQDFFDADNDEIPLEVEIIQEVLPDPGFRTLDTPAGDQGRKYLESRGIPMDVAMEYGIQYWPEQARVIFPVKTGQKWLGWQARYVKETSFYDTEIDTPISIPKVLTSLGTKKDRTLMFADRITGDHAVLCEGPMDALKAHLCGGNVATMGKAVSHQQIQLLRNSGVKKIYLALDPDAFREAQRLLKNIDDLEFYDLRPPAPFEDIGEMTLEQVRATFDAAPRIDRNFLFVYLKDHYAGQ